MSKLINQAQLPIKLASITLTFQLAQLAKSPEWRFDPPQLGLGLEG